MSVRGDPGDRGDTAGPPGVDETVPALFDAHFTRMLRVALVLLRDVEAAEDVVQEAFLALWTNRGRVRDKQDALGYLHRSVVNGARSRLRRRVVAERFEQDPGHGPALSTTLFTSRASRPGKAGRFGRNQMSDKSFAVTATLGAVE